MTARVGNPAKSTDMFISTIYVLLATILTHVLASTNNLGEHLVTIPYILSQFSLLLSFYSYFPRKIVPLSYTSLQKSIFKAL